MGVDLDEEVLDWGKAHHAAGLKPKQRDRLKLIKADVLTANTDPVDAVLAMNFSYYLFTTRENLKAYFEKVREALVDDGILFLDAFGGYDAHRELEERTEYDDFTYVWDQASFDPDQSCNDLSDPFRVSGRLDNESGIRISLAFVDPAGNS